MSDHTVAPPLRAVENLDGAGRLLRVETQHVTYEIDETSRCFRRTHKTLRPAGDTGVGDWIPYEQWFLESGALVVRCADRTVRSATVESWHGRLPSYRLDIA